MRFCKYLCLVFAIMAFGLVACSDSSSNADPDTLKCVVKSEKPLIMESSFNGVFSRTTVELRGGKLIQTVESPNARVIDENCKALKSDSDYGEVLCDAESVVAISREEMSEIQIGSILLILASRNFLVKCRSRVTLP